MTTYGCIKYHDGVKYWLAEDYRLVGLHDWGFPLCYIETDWIKIDECGLLVRKGYAWDGATGYPDVDRIKRASLIHDALYHLMRLGLLDRKYRENADRVLRDLIIQDSELNDDGEVCEDEANFIYNAVQFGAARAATAEAERPIRTAPLTNRR